MTVSAASVDPAKEQSSQKESSPALNATAGKKDAEVQKGCKGHGSSLGGKESGRKKSVSGAGSSSPKKTKSARDGQKVEDDSSSKKKEQNVKGEDESASKKKKRPKNTEEQGDAKKTTSEESAGGSSSQKETDEKTAGMKKGKSAKRRERAKKKAASTLSYAVEKSLSAEGLALLQKIAKEAEERKKKGELRTGKISMTELMGSTKSGDLERLHLESVRPDCLLEVALKHMPQVPGFPSLSMWFLFKPQEVRKELNL